MDQTISSLEDTQSLLRCARGDEPADLVLKNCSVINVFSAEIIKGDVAILGNRIAGVGDYNGREEIDLQGAHVCPGFIDGHIHIESSMLSPVEFGRAVAVHGTTAVICDPHEIANVAGLPGIHYILDQGAHTGVDIFAMAPSCVPATHMETAGARLGSDEVAELLKHPAILGLAEMMNFPGAVGGDPSVLAKLEAARRSGLLIDGHAPGLCGKALQAYRGTGIDSDHECVDLEEAREKLRAGMYIFIREGSTAQNLANLLPLVTPAVQERCLLVSDDKDPNDLLTKGHLDHALAKAVALGLDPVSAIRLVTSNAARRFGLRDRGAIGPGLRADLVVLSDLKAMRVSRVYRGGALVAADGKYLGGPPRTTAKSNLPSSINIDWSAVDFAVPARSGKLRVIGLIPDQIVTRGLTMEPLIVNDLAESDPDRDLIKIAVIERHRGSGAMMTGFVHGMGLKRGALATTVAHDSHNLVVVGASDMEMRCAAETCGAMGGGLAVVEGEKVIASLPLPIGGLMSESSLEEVAKGLGHALAAAKSLGCVPSNPFMAAGFLALPVIPELKITDKGLVDVGIFDHVPLWV